MVSTYIKSSTPSEGIIVTNFENAKNSNHDDFSSQFLQSELIYNLSDVEKFLPQIQENAQFDDICGETFTRKRKERQDSGSFSVHECKVIRSNSEERSVEEKISSEDNIRRVSSHEDFEKCRKPINRAQGTPLHEQNHDENWLPLKAHNRLQSSNESVSVKDCNKSGMVGEKFSKIFSQEIDNENTLEHYNFRQKYSKNDSSPLRSSIHEYVLFPKRISPNRDPNVIGRERMCGQAEGWEIERDAEKARSSERRSRVRRAPQRRQSKCHMPDRNISRLGHHSFNHSLDQNKHNGNISYQRSKEREIISAKDKSNCGFIKDNIISCDNMALPKNKEKDNNLVENTFPNFYPNETIVNDVSKKIRERSQSPVIHSIHSISPMKKTPLIDLKMLHEHLGKNEPIPSISSKFPDLSNDGKSFEKPYEFNFDSEPLLDDNITGYSKAISEIQNQKRILPDKCDFDDPEVLGGTLVMEPDERLNKITKKIQTLKKRIAKCEVDFEVSHGYRASHADKMNDSTLRKMYAEMRKLKSERKSIKKGPPESVLRSALIISNEEQSLKNKPISEIMNEIERRLEAKRWAHGRPSELEMCSRTQLVEEKAAVQRALLWLEGARGRPTSRPDRDSARPLYDRYRAVKRLVAGFDAMKLNTTSELATIMEHETLPTLESPAESPESGDKTSNSDGETKDSSSENKELEDGASSSAKSTASDKPILPVEEKQEIINENLHCLSLDELNRLLIEAKALKTTLRASIRNMEECFDEQNARKIKDDKNPILPTYAKYKETKARIRLLSALVNKQKNTYG